MVTKEQFAEWKAHPVTIAVYEEVRAVRQRLSEELSRGATLGYEAEATHGATNKLVGQIEGLNQLLELKYEDDDGEAPIVDNSVLQDRA